MTFTSLSSNTNTISDSVFDLNAISSIAGSVAQTNKKVDSIKFVLHFNGSCTIKLQNKVGQQEKDIKAVDYRIIQMSSELRQFTRLTNATIEEIKTQLNNRVDNMNSNNNVCSFNQAS